MKILNNFKFIYTGFAFLFVMSLVIASFYNDNYHDVSKETLRSEKIENSEDIMDVKRDVTQTFPIENILVDLYDFSNVSDETFGYIIFDDTNLQYVTLDGAEYVIETIDSDSENVIIRLDAEDMPYLEVIKYAHYDNDYNIVDTWWEYLFHLVG